MLSAKVTREAQRSPGPDVSPLGLPPRPPPGTVLAVTSPGLPLHVHGGGRRLACLAGVVAVAWRQLPLLGPVLARQLGRAQGPGPGEGQGAAGVPRRTPRAAPPRHRWHCLQGGRGQG